MSSIICLSSFNSNFFSYLIIASKVLKRVFPSKKSKYSFNNFYIICKHFENFLGLYKCFIILQRAPKWSISAYFCFLSSTSFFFSSSCFFSSASCSNFCRLELVLKFLIFSNYLSFS